MAFSRRNARVNTNAMPSETSCDAWARSGKLRQKRSSEDGPRSHKRFLARAQHTFYNVNAEFQKMSDQRSFVLYTSSEKKKRREPVTECNDPPWSHEIVWLAASVDCCVCNGRESRTELNDKTV
jgi:hypothetical protein